MGVNFTANCTFVKLKELNYECVGQDKLQWIWLVRQACESLIEYNVVRPIRKMAQNMRVVIKMSCFLTKPSLSSDFPIILIKFLTNWRKTPCHELADCWILGLRLSGGVPHCTRTNTKIEKAKIEHKRHSSTPCLKFEEFYSRAILTCLMWFVKLVHWIHEFTFKLRV